MTRVFLVDDHPLVREWMGNLIQQQPDLTLCGEADNAAAALAAIGRARPDVAVVDLSLDGRSGLELIKDLKLQHPATSVLVLSMYDEELYAERALRAGARGYVMKREVTKNIIEAIRCVRSGRLYLSPRVTVQLAEKVALGPADPAATPLGVLSDRELEVFRLLGRGRPTREIADELHVSAKTVQSYCARIKEKLALTSSTALLREAIRWSDEEAPS